MMRGYGYFGDDAAVPAVPTAPTAPQEMPPPVGYIPVSECELKIKSAAEAAQLVVTPSQWKRLVGPGFVVGLIVGWILFK